MGAFDDLIPKANPFADLIPKGSSAPVLIKNQSGLPGGFNGIVDQQSLTPTPGLQRSTPTGGVNQGGGFMGSFIQPQQVQNPQDVPQGVANSLS